MIRQFYNKTALTAFHSSNKSIIIVAEIEVLVEAKTLDSRTMIGTKACQEEEDKEAIVGLLTGEITEEAEEEEVVDEIDEIQFFFWRIKQE